MFALKAHALNNLKKMTSSNIVLLDCLEKI